MGKKKLTGKNRLDKFYHLAKEQGYRSRASFKLLQLDSKYTLLNSSRSVLDLCAAPGGWMQIAVQKAPVGALVVGVDLCSISPIRGAISVQEDITSSKCRATIKRLLAENGFKAFDLILHDGSPNVGGAWAQEATVQNSLVIDSIRLATEFLAPKGNFVTKVFRARDYNAVVYCLNKFFHKVEVFKPIASRLSSAEIYVVGLRYKAPAKIDPRMLDTKYLFEAADEPRKVMDVLDGRKPGRSRDGYKEGLTLVRKICSAHDFVWSDNPLEMLGVITSISFDDSSSLPLKEHALTTEEIITLCDDLYVLGKQDFKHLLKWRTHVRKAISSKTPPIVETVKDTEDGDGDTEEKDEDDNILDEMEEMTHAIGRKVKRDKKKDAKRRAKDKVRTATGMQIDAMQDGYVDDELFALGSIKGKNDLAAVDATEDVEVGELHDSDTDIYEADDHDESSDLDSDEERERYDEKMETILDDAYERYVIKKGGSTMKRQRTKKAYSDQRLEDTDDVEEIAEPYDSDKDEAEQEANPLVVPIDEEADPTQEQLKLRWFSDNIFVEAVEEGDLGRAESDDDMEDNVPEQKVSLPTTSPKSLKNKTGTEASKKKSTMVKDPKPVKAKDQKKDDSDDDIQDIVQDHKASLEKKASKILQTNSGSETRKKKAAKVEDDLEVVPAPGNSSDSSSSDDDSEYDTDTKATIRAAGKKLLGSKRKRQEMEDMAYNKHNFDQDLRGFPEWFVADYKKHNQPPKIVTKEELLAEKALFNAINTRPAKKVAEAKARKKRAAMKTLEKVRKKANSIVDQTDINDRSKRRIIDQLYKKSTPKKPGKEKVVAKKGVQVRPGKGKVLVDRRMKKDARQQGMKKKVKEEKARKKGKGKGKGPAPSGKGGNKGKR